mgnify:CR=1 FL=1
MPLFKKVEYQLLDSLVLDTISYGFKEPQAMEYINKSFTREISKDAYYERKKKLSSNQEVKQWLDNFTRIGFVIRHRNIIAQTETIISDLWTDYLTEQSKPYDDRDHARIDRYRHTINDFNKMLQELSLGSPIVSQIKQQIERYEKQIMEYKTKNKVIDVEPVNQHQIVPINNSDNNETETNNPKRD